MPSSIPPHEAGIATYRCRPWVRIGPAVHVTPPDPAEVARIAKEQEILNAQEAQRKQQQSVDDKKKAQQDREKQARCDAARNHYFSMKDSRRIFHLDADGNRVYDTDPEADARREDAKQAMTTACGT